MAGLENAPLPAGWPQAQPGSPTRSTFRKQRARYASSTADLVFGRQHIPVVAERVQVDTYVACQVSVRSGRACVRRSAPRPTSSSRSRTWSASSCSTGFLPAGWDLAPGQRFALEGRVHRSGLAEAKRRPGGRGRPIWARCPDGICVADAKAREDAPPRQFARSGGTSVARKEGRRRSTEP